MQTTVKSKIVLRREKEKENFQLFPVRFFSLLFPFYFKLLNLIMKKKFRHPLHILTLLMTRNDECAINQNRVSEKKETRFSKNVN